MVLAKKLAPESYREAVFVHLLLNTNIIAVLKPVVSPTEYNAAVFIPGSDIRNIQ